MPESTDTTPAQDAEPDTTAAAADQGDSTTTPAPELEGTEQLGDAGKRALDAMKAKWKAAEKKAADALAELSKVGKTPDEQAIEDAKRAATAEAIAKANARILKSEIRAQATGKLADPADALVHLDLSDFTVAEDGTVNQDEVSTAIADLLQRKPYLGAAKAAAKPQPNPAQGPRPAAPTDALEAEYERFKQHLFPNHNTTERA